MNLQEYLTSKCRDSSDPLDCRARVQLLEESFVENDHYKKVKQVEGDTLEYFKLIQQHGLEGIVKKKDSKYEIDRRSWNWQKVINWIYAEVYITGYRKKDFGWLTSIVSV
ncbi:hypothetical protein [Paenibacillus periandrae]|uniref:ATP-dependent DNA ligase n=1 Tax=Paenibacillus periandrae TaxID=1761741 RepID=UPI001F088E11|nr:hypothetical protein [Paenibacillus periandrae]